MDSSYINMPGLYCTSPSQSFQGYRPCFSHAICVRDTLPANLAEITASTTSAVIRPIALPETYGSKLENSYHVCFKLSGIDLMVRIGW